MNNWMDALFQLFGRKKRNRGFLWASLIGLGVSTAAYAFKRKGNRRTNISLENVLDTFRQQNSGYTPAAAAATEIADELAPVAQDFLKQK